MQHAYVILEYLILYQLNFGTKLFEATASQPLVWCPRLFFTYSDLLVESKSLLSVLKTIFEIFSVLH